MTEIKILDHCIGCGACVAVCNVTQVYKMGTEKAVVASARRCWECGQCVAVCPVDAIDHSVFPLENCPPVAAFSEVEAWRMVEVLQSRRSVRVFKTKPVPRPMIENLLAISHAAPSAKNRQAVDWIAIDNANTIQRLAKLTVAALAHTARQLRKEAEITGVEPERQQQLMGYAKSLEFLERRQDRGEDAVFYHAPVLLLAHVPQGEFGEADAVYAAYSLMLAAHLQGLGTCQIGYFTMALQHSEELAEQVKVPQGREISVALILGFAKYRYRRAVIRRKHTVSWLN